MDEGTRSRATCWAGVGILVAGIGVLGCALVVADDVYPTGVGTAPYTMVVEQYQPGVALGFAAACGAFAAPTLAWALVLARLGAAGRARAHPLPWLLPVVGVVLSGIGIFSFVRWVQVSAAPFPGDRALLVTSACAIVLVGTVVVHHAATRMWSSEAAPRACILRGYEAFAGGVLAVVVVAGTVVDGVGERSRVDATTAAVAQAPAGPADPTRVVWRWSEGGEISDVVAAGAGVVVATADGIVALDGGTGEERWHHRLTDVQPEPDVVAVDEGRGVVASFDGRLHAFDAFTGELRWRDSEESARTRWDEWIAATDSIVVRQRYGPVQFAGTDVRTGEMRWQYTPPSQCDLARADAIGGTVIISNWCDEVTALDGATGEVLWHESPPGEVEVRAGMILSPEAHLRLDPTTGQESRAEDDGWVVASDSGELITSNRSLYESGAAEPRWQLPGLSPPATDDHWNTCAATFLADAAVLLDFRDHGEFRLTVVDRADGTVRRSFGDAELPAANDWVDTEVLAAPGAVVVRGSNELVAFG